MPAILLPSSWMTNVFFAARRMSVNVVAAVSSSFTPPCTLTFTLSQYQHHMKTAGAIAQATTETTINSNTAIPQNGADFQ